MHDQHVKMPADDNRPLPLTRLVMIGAVLPAIIAAANYTLQARVSGGAKELVVLQAAWYVVQVGIVGMAVGRGIDHRLLRWIVFGWLMLLIDMLAWLQAVQPGANRARIIIPATAALYGGQIGLSVVWAFLGDTRWLLRWPAMLATGTILFVLWRSIGQPSQRMWTELLVLNVFTLSILCWLLQRAGFRVLALGEWAAAEAAPGGSAERSTRALQFGLKHMLLWMSGLAVLLGLARAFDLLSTQAAMEMMRGGVWKLTVATASAMVMVVGLWVALGRGHWRLRYLLGVAIWLVLGCALSLWSLSDAAELRNMLLGFRGVWQQTYFEILRWYDVAWWWLGWLFLSGGLLAATLIILRARGYRLVRMSRSPVPQ